MRIVSYNILDGGEGRADPLAEVILARSPDVVCLLEADDRAVLERISKRLKMEYVLATAGRDGVALFSRWPIVQSVDHAVFREGFTGSFLEAVFAEPGGREWPIGVVHLSAQATEEAEKKREVEIAAVLDAFAGYRSAGRPHFLAGDFNSNAPLQHIEPADCKPATRRAWEENGGMVPRRVVQRLIENGYRDSLHAFSPHYAVRSGSFTTQTPGQRVDYIFSFGVEQARDAWIEQDRLAKYASDHFPVGLEI
jgi:endonuclease/exonuclease/phosphatase family metal-dependent hydrolase